MSRCCCPAIPLTWFGLIYSSTFPANEQGRWAALPGQAAFAEISPSASSSRWCWGRIWWKVKQHFLGWTWLEGCRAMAVPAALSGVLCWAKYRGPESLPLVGIFIQMATTVGRRTLIIHLCPVNFNRGKQTVLQISSPGFGPLLYLAGNMGRCWRNRFCSNLSTPKLHKCSICCARLLNMSIFNSSNVP